MECEEQAEPETAAATNGQQLDESSSETEPNAAHLDFAEWHGKSLVDIDGMKIGKLEGVYFDVETEQAQFATVKEGRLAGQASPDLRSADRCDSRSGQSPGVRLQGSNQRRP